MKIDNSVLACLMNATRMVRAGDLRQATTAIQDRLRSLAAAGVPAPSQDACNDAAIEGSFVEVETVPESPTTRQPDHTPASQPLRKDDHAHDGLGQFVARSFQNQAGTRAYKLFVPSSYCGHALPLIVMLHGCTQSPDDFAAGTRMNAIAEEQGCLVAYPEQARSANPSLCWNWFNASDQQRDRGEPSLIAGIARRVMNDYAVDATRVYVAGLSSGGAMAAIMGTTYPDLFAAIGVHSGLACGAAHDLPSALAAMRSGTGDAVSLSKGVHAEDSKPRIPMIVFHGDRDTTVHPRNGDQLVTQWIAGEQAGAGATDMGSARTTEDMGRAPNGRGYTRRVLHARDGKPMVEHWRLHGAGHAWSGGSNTGSYTDPSGPDATRHMFRFFRDHPK